MTPPVEESPLNNEELKRDELIFALIQRQMDQEIRRRDTLDSKANIMIGFISIITSIFLGVGFLGISSQLGSLPNWSYFGTMSALMTSLILALIAFRVQKWPSSPNVQTLIPAYSSKPYREVLKTNAATLADAVHKVVKKNENKALLINVSWYLLVSGLAILILGIAGNSLNSMQPVENSIHP